MLRTPVILAAMLLGAAAPGLAQSSGRYTPSELTRAYPRWRKLVYAAKATASTSYGAGYTPRDAAGPPNVFPRFGTRKGAWTCKSKTSKAEWLEVVYPPTQARGLIVFETACPGAIRKVVVGGQVVYATSAPAKRYREAQALWVEFGEVRAVDRVRVHLDASLVRSWPELDAVALIPASLEAASKPAPAGATGGKSAGGKSAAPGSGSAGPASGSGARWGVEEYRARTKAELVVFATGATASSSYSASRYSAAQATGKPDVFSALKDSPLAWTPKLRNKPAWLEVSFPPTSTRWIYVYETKAPGTIRSIVDGDGALLFKSDAAPRKSYSGGQVLFVELPAARTIARLRINVDPRLLPGDYVEIDAVALGTRGPAGGAFVSKGSTWSSSDQYYLVRARREVTAIRQTLAGRGGARASLSTRKARAEADKIKARKDARYVELLQAIEEVEAQAQELQRVSKKKRAALGADVARRVQAEYAYFKSHVRGNPLLPSAPKTYTRSSLANFAAALKAAVADLRRRLAFLREVAKWAPEAAEGVPYSISRGQGALSKATHSVDALRGSLKAGQKVDLSKETTKTLREAAWNRGANFGWSTLKSAVKKGELLLAFYRAYAPDSALEAAVADVRRRLKAFNAAITTQIASERLPKGDPAFSHLLSIARPLLKKSSHLVVTTGKETMEGVWTSRDLIGTKDDGTYVTKTYRVERQPYKYDRFWVAGVEPHPENYLYVVVYDYAVGYTYYGDKPLKTWRIYTYQRRYLMLKENLPK